MDRDKATFTILEEPPEEVTTEIRNEIANAHEPYKLYKVKPFDHDGPYAGKLEVVWLPGHRHIALCWDHSADVPRLQHSHKWFGEGAESADVRCLTDGIEEYLNQHDRFTAEQHYHHG